ncbi:MAG: DUF4255 domain-containing protein [Bacteroidota bacterium]
MLLPALQLLLNQLNAAIPQIDGVEPVVMGNIAMLDGQDGGGANENLSRMVMSLVNLEEESTLKNGTHHRMEQGRLVHRNRPVFLNAYLLFSSNFPDYPTSIRLLGEVVEFFQSKKVFTFHNTQHHSGLPTDDPEVRAIRLILELFTLTFEQINHLWGSLGGKQVPFAMYKVRLVEMDAKRTTAEGSPITEIYLNE